MLQEDLYPSRNSAEYALLKRKDPVVYSDWTPSAPLSERQTGDYQNDGVLLLNYLFDEQEIEALRDEANRLLAVFNDRSAETVITEPDSGAVRSIFKIHSQSEVFARLAGDARLVNIARFLLGDDVYIHQSRLNYKPGFEGKDFYWHSDFETWHVEDGLPRMRALSMSVLLEENTAANGPTLFMRGSHRRYVSCVGETPDEHYKQSLKKQEYGVPAQPALSVLARNGLIMGTGKAGTVVIFDSNIMHGSNSNITPYPRANAFFVYNAVSNRPKAPFGAKSPRPEFIAARRSTEAITPTEHCFSEQTPA